MGGVFGAVMMFVSTVLPIPAGTPIPCLICAGTAAQSTLTFSGTISHAGPQTLTVYDFTSLRKIAFTVPPDVHAGALQPGQHVRVTYSSSYGTNVAIRVELLPRATIPSRNAL